MCYSGDESPKTPYRFPKNFHRAEPALVAAVSADGVVLADERVA